MPGPVLNSADKMVKTSYLLLRDLEFSDKDKCINT